MTRRLIIACGCALLLAQFAGAAELSLIGPARDGKDYAPPALKDLGKAHKIHAVYFIPADREPTKDHQAKFETLMAFVSDVYRRDLTAKGIRSDGPDFVFEKGKLQVTMLRGKQPASYYNGAPKYSGDQTWKTVLEELKPLGDPYKTLFIVLTETCDEGPYPQEWPGHFALGAQYSSEGGVGMFSSWILRDEFCATSIEGQMKLMADDTPMKGRTAMGWGQMDSPRFQFINDGFGAVVHEMGHAFGAPHDMRRDSNFIMTNGFRNLRNNYLGKQADKPLMCFSEDNGRLVGASRFLNDAADMTDHQAPKVKLALAELPEIGANEIHLTGSAEDDKGLACVVYYVTQGDSVRGGAALEGMKGALDIKLGMPPLKPGQLIITAMVADRGGNIGRASLKVQLTPAAPATRAKP